jgi:hypothetical protein
VGPQEKRFTIHQDVICDKSKFFKAACSKRWIEGHEKLVRLPEVKPEVFQHYFNWIYSGVVHATRITPESDTVDGVAEHELFLNLYIHGDTLEDVQLRNLTTQRFCTSLRSGGRLPNYNTCAKTWAATPPGSLFRKQIIDVIIARYCRDDFAVFAENLAGKTSEFLQEFAIAALRKLPITTWDAVVGNNDKYLEPEEPKVNTT